MMWSDYQRVLEERIVQDGSEDAHNDNWAAEEGSGDDVSDLPE